MANKKSISVPKKGMNRDTSPFELSKEEYSLMLNGNIHDEHGNGKAMLQNEPSNFLCSRFKPGFKVIGHKYDINAERTYFFILNPTTTVSEIGYVGIKMDVEGSSPVEQGSGDTLSAVLETPLELTTQTISCEYVTLITDYCTLTDTATGCLGFSLDNPIKDHNIHIKDERSGKTIYFTDNLNPQRYLQLDDLEIYNQDIDDCTQEITETCLQCDKLRIFPLHDKPCIQPEIIQNGGNLRAGTYEALIAASDISGNEITNYYSITNPISIFDKNNNILDQTNLNYLTSQAIGLDIVSVDTRFEYYKIVVIYRSGLDASSANYVIGVYPITQNKVTIYTLVDKDEIDFTDIIARRPFYTKSEGLAVANDYLWHTNPTQHRTINLQQIVNLMGSLVQWNTIQAPENLYENGVFVSLYEGYNRDEVVPLAIQFFSNGGYTHPLEVFIPRPPTASEIEVLDAEGSTFVSNTNTDSVLENNPDCSENLRNKRWQFENTATILDRCVVPAEGTEQTITERELESTCYVSDEDGVMVLDTIAISTFQVTTTADLVTYINTHLEEIIASTGSNGSDIRDILEDPTDYPESCTPDFGDNCSEDIELVSEEMFAISVETEEYTTVNQDYDDYDRVDAPAVCNIYQLEDDAVTLVEDTAFVTSYMNPGDTVYARLLSQTNGSCATATPLSTNTALPNTNFLLNKGEITTYGTLQTTLDASQTSLDLYLTLTGTSGTANVIVNGVPYLATFSGNLTTTAANFVTAHAAAILTATGLTVTASTGVLHFTGDFFVITIANVTGDLNGTIASTAFTDKIHSNGRWFQGNFVGQDFQIVEISPTLCSTPDDNTATTMRVSVFATCVATGDLVTYSRIIDDVTTLNDTQKFIELAATDFGGTASDYFVVIDSPIKTRVLASTAISNTLTPTCGCFQIYQREVVANFVINYTNLTFGKKQKYRTLCEFVVPELHDCDPIPYETGKFSYWESTEKYLCNPELYDSSQLIIPDDILPEPYKTYFESYYVDSITGGNYDLNPTATNFMDKPIRHYKFPDSSIVPFMSFEKPGVDPENHQAPVPFGKSVIYPIGFFLSNDVINAFLDVAVLNGLLTADERVNITSYEIFRGDRRVDKSIIAKGLLFDMYQYQEANGTFVQYPNYPLNTLGTDSPNNNVLHDFNSQANKLFTFHSPNTHFDKPTLPRELRLEGYQLGHGSNYFDEVRGHSTYVILGDRAYALANILAGVEVLAETLMQTSLWLVTGAAGGSSSPAAIVTAVAVGAAYVIAAAFKFGEYRYQWQETFRNLGRPANFAYYQVCVGNYEYFMPNPIANSMLRGLTVDTYLRPGRWAVTDETLGGTILNVNNVDRESSVMVSMGTDAYRLIFPPEYYLYDNESSDPANASRRRYDGTGRSGLLPSHVGSPYASLKQYLPAQYGSINSINWINTGYCGNLGTSSECDPIFGGDTYISRFSLKRKLPYFTSNAADLPPLIPFKYSDYFNINPNNTGSRYFLDYLLSDDGFLGGFYIFPNNKSEYNLDSVGTSSPTFYVEPPNKFYLFSYGIPYFLVESEINCNYRYAGREPHENFYPNVGDAIEWTQEQSVSIKKPEEFKYNTVYSQGHSAYPWRMLPGNYSQAVYDRLNDLTNTAIYSKQDKSQNTLVNPWLIYRAFDSVDFPKSFGKLVVMDGIESEQVLARFTNGFAIFNAVDQLADKLQISQKSLGTGGIFAGRAISFNKTQLGYAGTQHSISISCEAGHFWTDAKRGKVFQLAPNGQGLEEISKGEFNSGLEKWFKTNLPFKILNFAPDLNIDNSYKGVGISMGWDDRLKRVFITKLDYVPKTGVCYTNGTFYYTLGFDALIAQYEADGYTYEGLMDCRLRFTKVVGRDTEVIFEDTTEIRLGDSAYFTDCSFTVAYNPMLKGWVSYYSFKPNYYVNYNDYFQTGINFADDSTELGLWDHLPYQSSYQVFYGKLYPFIVEYPLVTQGTASRLNAIEYWLDVRKYYDSHNFADIYGIGFNKAVVFNSFQNSGQLNLIFQNLNDLQQLLTYPKYNVDSIDILQTEINGKWAFNWLFNHLRGERSGLPLFSWDCPQIIRTWDARLFDYRNTYHDFLRGDTSQVQLVNDLYSTFKFSLRWSVDDRDFYND